MLFKIIIVKNITFIQARLKINRWIKRSILDGKYSNHFGQSVDWILANRVSYRTKQKEKMDGKKKARNVEL